MIPFAAHSNGWFAKYGLVNIATMVSSQQAHKRNVRNPSLLLQPFFGLAWSIVNVNTFDGWSLVVR